MTTDPTPARLVEIIREYAQHDSWRCEHPPHFYLASPEPLPDGTCPCGLVDALHATGLHWLAIEFDPREEGGGA